MSASPLYPRCRTVRITFDKDLRTGVFSRDLFDPGLPTVSAMGGYDMILEVKFNEHLPAYYHGLLQVESAQRSAVSKYISAANSSSAEGGNHFS